MTTRVKSLALGTNMYSCMKSNLAKINTSYQPSSFYVKKWTVQHEKNTKLMQIFFVNHQKNSNEIEMLTGAWARWKCVIMWLQEHELFFQSRWLYKWRERWTIAISSKAKFWSFHFNYKEKNNSLTRCIYVLINVERETIIMFLLG